MLLYCFSQGSLMADCGSGKQLKNLAAMTANDAV